MVSRPTHMLTIRTALTIGDWSADVTPLDRPTLPWALETSKRTACSDALSVFAGNLRRFMEENERANAEDGTLEITIVEPLSGFDAVVESVIRRLLHRETSHVTDLQSDRLEISGLDDTRVTFSLDGEIRSGETVRISVRPQALSVRVGDEYVPQVDRGFEENDENEPPDDGPRK